MTTEIRGITHHGRIGEVLNRVSAEEWAFYDLADVISDQIAEFMEMHDISKAELARRLGKSRSWVTQVLRGDKNMTLKTMAEVLLHLDAKLEMKIVSKDENVQWVGVDIQTHIRAAARKREHDAIPGKFLQADPSLVLRPSTLCQESIPFQAAA